MSEEQTDQPSKLSLVKLIPVTVVVTVLSQITLLYYYNIFGFNPSTYFEPSEIIVSAVKDFVIVGLLMTVYFQISILYVPDISGFMIKKIVDVGVESRNSRRGSQRIMTVDQQNIRNIREARIQRLLTSCICLSFIVWAIYSFISDFRRNDLTNMEIILYSGTLFSIFFTFTYSEFHYFIWKNHQKSAVLKNNFLYINPFIVFALTVQIIFSAAISEKKAAYVLNEKPFIGTQLILEDGEIIKSTTKVILVGKSTNYYFFYNTPDKSMRVIRRDQIKKESLKCKESFMNVFYRF